MRRSAAWVALALAWGVACAGLAGQATPNITSQLDEFQGEHVVAVELAGRPDIGAADIAPLIQQAPNTPLDPAQVQASERALEAKLHVDSLQVDIRPEANGIRILLIPPDALYFGIYQFPGAERFSYTRLIQVADYTRQEPYRAYDLARAQTALLTYYRQQGYFQASLRVVSTSDTEHRIVNVRFVTTLGRKARFGQVRISGVPAPQAEALEGDVHSLWARLHRAAIRPGKGYSYGTLQNATSYLRGKLAGSGHLAAQVHLKGAEYHADTNRADIDFEAVPGPAVTVKVVGAHLWPWTKHSLLPVYSATTESFASGTATTVDPELVQEGQQALLAHFQSAGYFAAAVTTTTNVQAAHESIVYTVSKGARHKVEAVTISGNHALSDKTLKPDIQVKTAHLFSHGTYTVQLARDSVSSLTAAYQAAGFSQVRVTADVDQPNGNVVVHFRVQEGPRDTVAGLTMTGNQHLTAAQLAPQGLKIAPGQPFSQTRVNMDRDQILETYLDRGYLNATFKAHATPAPGEAHRFLVTYTIVEGPLVRVGSLVTLGAIRSRPQLIQRNLTSLGVEQPLSQRAMFTTESKLYDTGVFDWTEVGPRRPITNQTNAEVLVKLHEAKRHTLTYGVGFEYINRGGSIPSGTVAVPGLPPVGLPSNFKTSEAAYYGPRGSVEYTLSNLTGRADSFSASALAGRLDQHAAFSYTDPNFRWSNWTATASVTGEHDGENPIFTAKTADLTLQLRRPLNAKHNANLLLQYSFSETGLSHLLIPALVPTADLHVRLSTLSATYTHDTRDNPINAHRGQYQSLELDLNPQALGSNVSFARLLAQQAVYRNIGHNVIWANSVRVGEEEPFNGSHVPLSQKFFTGGGSTLRGFPLDGAGPQNTIPACGNPSDPSTCSLITVPVGGNQLLILNSEFRIPLPLYPGLGMAAFYDGGNVFSQPGFHNLQANYTNSVGVGLRYETPVGPIRIDLGHNLDHLAGIKSTQLFITLGQAF